MCGNRNWRKRHNSEVANVSKGNNKTKSEKRIKSFLSTLGHLTKKY